MGIKGFGAKIFSKYVAGQIKKWSVYPVEFQHKTFNYLIENGKQTKFGRAHSFDQVKTYSDFKNLVPVRDYEALRNYIDEIINGKPDILWPGKPIYLSKTSGTTSGIKYIPITKSSIPCHINAARDALMNYVHASGNSAFFDGKMIFLSGSPELENKNGLNTGRLSGIVNHHVPAWLRGNQLPTYGTNCIEDWEMKLEKIIEETVSTDMRLISGIPPWVQMYFDKLIQLKHQSISQLFPNFSLFVHGGVNFEPYRSKLFESIGKKIDTLETYPASEGFIAYQDIPDGRKERESDNGLLLLVNNGIFYEFIPIAEFYNEHPQRLALEEVELGINYVIILNTNAGLWGYNIGDTVKFVSKDPYRVVVTGRVKHFISAFGEHVISEEVDDAMLKAAEEHGAQIVEFTVAPNISKGKGQSFHEWYVEFEKIPDDIVSFAQSLDQNLQERNIYYKDLIRGNILQQLKIYPMQQDAFRSYMKSIGKLGGQNKVPRLSNDRMLADKLQQWVINH